MLSMKQIKIHIANARAQGKANQTVHEYTNDAGKVTKRETWPSEVDVWGRFSRTEFYPNR